MKYTEKINDIETVITGYFEGLFYGDIQKLGRSFATEAYLYGDIRGEAYLKNLKDYLEGVAARKSPHELGEDFRMEILSVEVTGKVAVARLHVPMLGYNYYDHLALSKINGEWKIVNKLFVHVE